MVRVIPLAALIALGLATGSAAGEAQDRIFRTGLLDPVATGQTLVYRHDRGGPLAAEPAPPIDDGTIRLTLLAGDDGRRAVEVALIDDGTPQSRAVLPAAGGHPLMLLFLESSARTIAALTGGSPFYIRNRMRESLGEDVAVQPVEVTVDGTAIAAEAVSFQPFRDDPNRATLGTLAGLELTLTFSDALPGGLARLRAAAAADGAPAFAETIVFDHLEEED